MASYRVQLDHNITIRGLDTNSTVDAELISMASSEIFSGITAYQQINISAPIIESDAYRWITFDDLGMSRIALIIAHAPLPTYSPTLRFWSTGDTVDVLVSGRTTYLQVDNRLINVTGNTDGFRLVISGGTYTFDSDVYTLSGGSLSVYDIADRVQAAIALVDTGTSVVVSVNNYLGIDLEVTGSSDNTIVIIAPTGATAFDIRPKLFGSGGASSTSLGDDPNVFIGAICTNYAPNELVLEMFRANRTIYSIFKVLVIGIK